MKQANGFTLIELLAAMVAGSFLLASLSWTLSSLTRQLPIAPAALRGRQLERVAPVLTAMFERIRPLSHGDTSFSGERDKLTTIVPPPMSVAGAGPLRLSLSVRTTKEGQALFAVFTPLDASASLPRAGAGEHVLLSGYRSIELEYAGPAQGGNPLPRLPALISLRLVDPNGVTRRISATPRLTSDGRCRFDPISMTCRR